MKTSKTLVDATPRPLTGFSFWLVLLLSPLLSSPSSAGLLEMTELITHPEHYHRQEVVVMGKVKQVQPVIDREGQPAYKFLLEDGKGTIKVFCHLDVQEGDQVIVEGVFTRRRQGGRLTVYNEVDAISIRPLNWFHPELVG